MGRSAAVVALVVLVAFMAVLAWGVYNLAHFLILAAGSNGGPGWISTSSVPIWVCAVLLVLCCFGLVRAVTSYVTRGISFVFKFAQSDLVTIVLAVAVNIALLVLNGWATGQAIGAMENSGIPSYFTFANWFSVATFFLVLAGALIWIPRLGVYGENRLGQFDDN